MSQILLWLNFIRPATETNVITATAVLAGIIVAVSILLPVIMKRRANRWLMEWANEVRVSAIILGVCGLLLAWLSQQRVVVLGSRAWYPILIIVLLVRAFRLWGRYKHWSAKEKDEYRRLQQLKYIPGR